MIGPIVSSPEARLQRTGSSMPEGLDETMIREVVNRFYALVRNDEIIGPIFKSTVPNWQWQPHLDTIVEFWSSMLLGSRHDNGQPTPKHPALPELTDAQFGRWLALFRFTVNELCPPDIAAALIERSEEVGNSFHLNIRMHGGGSLVHLKPHEWEDYLPPEANGDHGDPAMAPPRHRR